MSTPNIYSNGEYLKQNPTWHEEDSIWKASQVQVMLEKHALKLRSVAEIGCGFGEVIAQLRQNLPGEIEFHGYDISQPAITHAKQKECSRLHYHNCDLLRETTVYDLLLVIDVVEHVPDYFGFLEGCRKAAKYKLYHIPLEIHVSAVARAMFLRSRQLVGHIHYFTAETALATLADTGHKVIDYFYTDTAIGCVKYHPSVKTTLANIPRKLLAGVSKPWASRLLGGYSLMVLAE